MFARSGDGPGSTNGHFRYCAFSHAGDPTSLTATFDLLERAEGRGLRQSPSQRRGASVRTVAAKGTARTNKQQVLVASQLY
jgi:hypothetical protein